MGWFEYYFPCFASYSPAAKEGGDASEGDRLIPPARERAQSITSQEGYGTMSMSSQPPVTSVNTNAATLTEQQRERMAEISRAAGNHMRPIGNYIAGTGRSIKVGTNSGRSVSPSPSDCSRSPSPASSRRSPERRLSSPSPPPSSTNSSASGNGSPEVVRKSIFGLDGPVMAGGSQRRRSSGPKRKAAAKRG
ncbi:hypothetical protein A1Q2_06149 [Trichosporon asahii var. asahii CBS 8904]|uniref:Uncharacterized protein n=2 Tax=Trichosporon asahii var. asahii TaxID=189963 RepID=K1WD14_TRIAC|nr:hypothetical protein A1Q1_02999 [Trichosporon asahii var. asahii CBS 2479]EJT48083.1 hypothetical protein A1Q1_02999 [Trichosporon asahii var. asahii CBS 2479]EKC99533.1 hypothetical protein A1Q2_06149 [Trichosporon asahii var. asahii CBS 8904]